MEQEILNKLAEQEKRLDDIYKSVEKTRKYFMWTLIITVAMVVIPIIGLVFVIPEFLNTLGGAGLGL